MRNLSIFYPVFALGAWTFLVLLRIPFVRVRSVRRREIGANDFKYGESLKVPPSVSITYNHVLHRLLAFTLSNVALVSLWVMAGTHVVSSG